MRKEKEGEVTREKGRAQGKERMGRADVVFRPDDKLIPLLPPAPPPPPSSSRDVGGASPWLWPAAGAAAPGLWRVNSR